MNMNEALKWINLNRDRLFEWGTCDCCTFTCDFVKTVTDVDPAEKHRGHYATEYGSKRALIKYGTVEESFDRHFDRVEPVMAKRGDVVMYSSPQGDTLGIKWSGGVLTISDAGVTLVDVPLTDMLTVWSINK
ncbi:hypothetical protein NVP2044O_21 [Vibrio phage 2.044.O._10N.261.51.B8]|nr:hypothetical protein NVP2044O_21 [Vibrio phage 2.044.O._10N.261.51.B8]